MSTLNNFNTFSVYFFLFCNISCYANRASVSFIRLIASMMFSSLVA